MHACPIGCGPVQKVLVVLEAPEQACRSTVHSAVSPVPKGHLSEAAQADQLEWGTGCVLLARQPMAWLRKVLPGVWLEGQGKERRNYRQERTQQEEEDKESTSELRL